MTEPSLDDLKAALRDIAIYADSNLPDIASVIRLFSAGLDCAKSKKDVPEDLATIVGIAYLGYLAGKGAVVEAC